MHNKRIYDVDIASERIKNYCAIQERCKWDVIRKMNDFGLSDKAKDHILKILTHYIPEEKIYNIIREFDTVWLYRKDTLKQFLSHVARLRTQVNLVYTEEDISSLNSSIKDNSLVAKYREYLTFKKRLELFWDLYYTRDGGTLVEYERFVSDPLQVGWEIMEDYNLEWIGWEATSPEDWPKIRMPLGLGIDYEKKFKNIDEIKEWIDV